MTHGIQRKLLSTMGATAAASIMFAAAPAAASGICNQGISVGGGTAVVSPSPGAGWDVGSGQCNGDFTVASNPSFPGGALELGMRIEQRSAGQLNAPLHAGINYEVQTGADPSNATRAWWNFHHSIAYNGVINDLDSLTFIIRTDEGPILPTAPSFDMLALRGIVTGPYPGTNVPGAIDARHAPSPTSFGDIYQTSQNPVFGWFTPNYNLGSVAAGAWTLTLYALKAGQISSVSICAHTPTAACAAPPAVYTCGAFASPMDKVISVKKNNRVLPLKMVCTGNDPTAAPIVQVTKSLLPGDATTPADTYLSAGQGTDGNEFVFDGVRWNFNLQTKNFTGTGTYTITAVSGGGDLLVGAPVATFVVQ